VAVNLGKLHRALLVLFMSLALVTVGVRNAEPAQAAVTCYGYVHHHQNSRWTISVQTPHQHVILRPGQTFWGSHPNPAWMRISLPSGSTTIEYWDEAGRHLRTDTEVPAGTYSVNPCHGAYVWVGA
jgi:hypothetical protein